LAVGLLHCFSLVGDLDDAVFDDLSHMLEDDDVQPCR
jgi:hypothetical protein